MRNGAGPIPALAFHSDDVVAGFGKAVDGYRVTVGVQGIGITIGMHCYFRTLIAKIPSFISRRGTESTDLEGYRVPHLNVRLRGIAVRNSRGNIISQST